MENQLVRIDCKDWDSLRDVYLPETPKTVLGLSTISNYIRWIKQESTFENLDFYSLNGDWSDGTFVVLDRYHLYCDTLNESIDRLETLLNLLDYSKGVIVMHVRSKCYPAILKNFERKKVQLEFDDANLLYYLPKEKALDLNINVPEGFQGRSLTVSDVCIANERWKFKHIGSLFYLQRLARLNKNCGIVTADGNQLVSSGFQLQTGPIGTLHTNETYRNRGFGTLATKIIFKQIGESGYGATSTVRAENLASRAIFEKIGCSIIDEVHWIVISQFFRSCWTHDD